MFELVAVRPTNEQFVWGGGLEVTEFREKHYFVSEIWGTNQKNWDSTVLVTFQSINLFFLFDV